MNTLSHNGNGLRFNEWLRAAGYHAVADGKETASHDLWDAWRRDEDPTDHRAAQDAGESLKA